MRGGSGGDDRVDCLMDIGAQTQGLATLFLIPTEYASGPVNDLNWTVVGNTLAPYGNLGLGRGRLPGLTHTSWQTGLLSIPGPREK